MEGNCCDEEREARRDFGWVRRVLVRDARGWTCLSVYRATAPSPILVGLVRLRELCRNIKTPRISWRPAPTREISLSCDSSDLDLAEPGADAGSSTRWASDLPLLLPLCPEPAMLQPRLCVRLLGACPCLPPPLSRQYATAAAAASKADKAVKRARARAVADDTSGMRTYRPRTPGLRHLRRPINEHLWKGRCHLPLTYPRKGNHIGGRGGSGQISVRHRGGGHKRRIRMVDFSRTEPGEHLVDRIEHDPGRSAHIALITSKETKAKSYILATDGLRAGDTVQSYRQGIPDSLIESIGGTRDAAMIASRTAWPGNCLPLHMIPPGTSVFNVGLRPGKGGQLCRSAGTSAMVMGNSGLMNPKWVNYINVRLQTGEVRRIHREACATIGVASNVKHNRTQLGKAGRSRWLGIRPTVRGVAMNAFKHPHGGGRGKSKGNRIPVSIYGRTLVSYRWVRSWLRQCAHGLE